MPEKIHLRSVFARLYAEARLGSPSVRRFPYAALRARTVRSESLTLRFVRLKVNKGMAGPEILPVVWQDNYISLLPGEKRDLTATYRATALGTATADVKVNGWNMAPR